AAGPTRREEPVHRREERPRVSSDTGLYQSSGDLDAGAVHAVRLVDENENRGQRFSRRRIGERAALSSPKTKTSHSIFSSVASLCAATLWNAETILTPPPSQRCARTAALPS